MPKLQKSVFPLNLDKYRVWIVDTAPTSQYFRLSQVPDVLTSGKNAFLINGSTELVADTDVLVEIVDSAGNVVFSQPIRNYTEGLARLVSIEVYKDTAPGLATVTILGQLKTDAQGNVPPKEFKGAYNVKWSTKIQINPYKANTTPIRLYAQPVITPVELLAPYRDAVTGSIVDQTSGTATLIGRSATVVLSGASFNRDMIDSPFMTTLNGAPFTASITDVINTSTITLNTIPTASTGGYLANVTLPSYTIRYLASPSFISTNLVRSFANVHIAKLQTFSGDIARAKLYIRSVDQPGNYQLLTDVSLEETDLLMTQSSVTGDQSIRMGSITSQSVIDSYWVAGTVTGGVQYGPTTGVTASYDADVLLDSIYISQPTGAFASASSVAQAYIATTTDLSFFKGLEYTFGASLYGTKQNSSVEARMDVYVFGAAFPSSSQNPLGTRVASYVIPAGKTQQFFLDTTKNVVGVRDGTAKLYFVVYSGDWYMSDVTLKSARETGFNPDEIRIITPITGRRFERVVFKAELFDVNSNMVPVTIESAPLYINGGNTILKGGDSRIDGTVTVGASGSGLTITSNSPTSGGAIYTGGGNPGNVDTPFYLGDSNSSGNIFSIGDKLVGSYSGSNYDVVVSGTFAVQVGGGGTWFNVLDLISGSGFDQAYAIETATAALVSSSFNLNYSSSVLFAQSVSYSASLAQQASIYSASLAAQSVAYSASLAQQLVLLSSSIQAFDNTSLSASLAQQASLNSASLAAYAVSITASLSQTIAATSASLVIADVSNSASLAQQASIYSASLAAQAVAYSASLAYQQYVLFIASSSIIATAIANSASLAQQISANSASLAAYASSITASLAQTISNVSASLIAQDVSYSASLAQQSSAYSASLAASVVSVSASLSQTTGNFFATSASLAAIDISNSASLAQQSSLYSASLAAYASSITASLAQRISNVSASLIAQDVSYSASLSQQASAYSASLAASIVSTSASLSQTTTSYFAASASLAAIDISNSASLAQQSSLYSASLAAYASSITASLAQRIATVSSSLIAQDLSYSASLSQQYSAYNASLSASLASTSASLIQTTNNFYAASASLAAIDISNYNALVANISGVSASLLAQDLSYSASLAQQSSTYSASLAASIAAASASLAQTRTNFFAASASLAIIDISNSASLAQQAASYSASLAAQIQAISGSAALAITTSSILDAYNKIQRPQVIDTSKLTDGLYLETSSLGFFNKSQNDWPVLINAIGQFRIANSASYTGNANDPYSEMVGMANGAFVMRSKLLYLSSSGFLLAATSSAVNNVMMLGNVINANSGSGVYMSGDGTFRAGTPSGSYVLVTPSQVRISAYQFNMDAGGMFLLGHPASGSTNVIKLGTNASNLTIISGTGFYADGDGNFRAGYTSGALKDYIRFIPVSGGLDIQTTRINITASGMQIASEPQGTTTNFIKVGTNPSAITLVSGTGFYVDGGGNFRVGANTGSLSDYVRYSPVVGLDILTTRMNIVAGGMQLLSDPNVGVSNVIKVGPNPSAITFASGSGFYVDGGGNFRVGQATTGSAIDFLRYGPSVGLDLQTTRLSLIAGGIELSGVSGTLGAGNYLKIGTTPSTMTLLSGTGFYADGGGNFRIGYTSGSIQDFIRFIPASGGLDIQTTRIFITASGMNIVSEGTLAANNYIKVGANPNLITLASGTGFYVDGAGQFRVGANTGSSVDYIRYTPAVGLDVYTRRMNIVAGGMQLLSDPNVGVSNVIKVGLTPTTMTLLSGTGFYADGGGNFRVGYTSSSISGTIQEYIRFIPASGGLDIQTTRVNITASGLQLTSELGVASNNVLKIGGNAGLISFASGTGFYVDGAGFFRVGANTGSLTDYLRYSPSIGLDIQTSRMSLLAGGVQIIGASGSTGIGNVIKVGTTPSSMTLISGTGFYADGGGNVRFGYTSGTAQDYIRFTPNTNGLEIKTARLDITASGIQIVSDGTVSANNYMKLGSNPNTITFASGTGLYVDGAGNFRVGANTGSLSDYLRYSPSVGLDVYTRRMNIIAGGMQLLSDPNVGVSNVIKVGLTPTTMTLLSGTGFYADGGGNFRVGYTSSSISGTIQEYIRFIPASGGLDIQTTRVNITASGLQLTSDLGLASNNVLKIGGNAGLISFASGTGLYADGAGQFRVGANTGSRTDYLRYSPTVGLDIVTSRMGILAGGMQIIAVSGTTGAANVIKIGTTPSTMTLISGTGFYADGDGNFRVGYTSGALKDYIRFIPASGGLDIQTVRINITASGIHIASNPGVPSVNFIKIGNDPSNISFASGSGFYADGDGNFRIGANTGSSIDYVRYSPAVGLDVYTRRMNIVAGGIQLLSDPNVGVANVIKVGLTPTTMTLLSGTGFYADGGGNFRVGYTSSSISGTIQEYIRFIPASGGLDIQTTRVNITASGLQLTSDLGVASNNVLKIGGNAGLISFASGTGFYADGTGQFRVGANTGSLTDYLRYSPANGLAIQTSRATILAGGLYINTDPNTAVANVIKLGSSPTNITLLSGTGFYADGDGNWRVGYTSGTTQDYIRYIPSSGGLDVQTARLNVVAGSLRLTSDNLNSAANILKIGNNQANITILSGTGLYADGDGNFRVGFTSGTVQDYVRFLPTVGLDIQARRMNIVAGGMQLTSDASVGVANVIKVGPSISTMTLISGTGFYADGNGNWRAGYTSGSVKDYIRFVPVSGGLDIQTTRINITASGMQITSEGQGDVTNYIKVGNNPSAITFVSGTGMYVDGAGNFRVGANTGSLTDYVRYSPSVGLDILTTRMSIIAGGMYMISDPTTAAANVIKLGATPANITLASGSGFYADGAGQFRVGASTGSVNDFIRYSPVAGLSMYTSRIIMSASGMLLISDPSTAAANVLAIGANPGIITFVSGTGFYADGAANFRVGRTTGSLSDYIRYSSAVGLDIQTSRMALLAGGMQIIGVSGSTGNANVIKIGSNPSLITLSNRQGFYADGDGNFRVGTDSTGSDFVQYTVGGAFILKSRDFYLSSSVSGQQLLVNTSFIAIGKPAPLAFNPSTQVEGFYANYAGQIFIGSGSNVDYTTPQNQKGNFLSFGGQTLNIRANVFRLFGGNIVLDSAQNGLLALGNANSLANGMGFYADGLGNFRVGTATTGSVSTYMQFTGGQLTIQGRVSINDPTSRLQVSGGFTDMKQVIANYIAFGPFGFYISNL